MWSIKTKNPDRLLSLHTEEKVVRPGAYAKKSKKAIPVPFTAKLLSLIVRRFTVTG
jgi:hypothetical protein